MLGKLLRRHNEHCPELLTSTLFNEDTFYPTFIKDLNDCGSELIIECPFITRRRLTHLLPTLQKLKDRKVRIIVNTKDPIELDEERRDEAYRTVASLQHKSIQVIYTHGHHRKLAIIDRSILYEGSLNILSQNRSTEIMRRTESVQLAWQMARFVGVDRYL
ncbi:MAG TPA: phospholipase D-like domain-containing protein [Candidatus Saccharimonadales bacterium]|nr:phospholipase D-like domain-containing protein [Candidatus Saccharimonadales bacterium]